MESSKKPNDNVIGGTSLLNSVETEERNDDATCTSTTQNKRPNPLLNDLVMTNVVRLLDPSFEQLKTLRLVSKVWTQATLKLWRESAVLTIVPDPTFFERSKSYKTGVPISEFLTEFQDPNSPFKLSGTLTLPFEKYKLKAFSINFRTCMKPEERSFKFWNTIGPLMKSLHLYKCKFPRQHYKDGDFLARLLVEKIPNLKDLVLTDVPSHNVDPEKAVSSDEDNSSDDDDQGIPNPEEIKKPEKQPVVLEVPYSKLKTLTVYGPIAPDMDLRELFKLTPELEVIRGVDLPRESNRLDSLFLPIYQVRYHQDGPPRLSNVKTLDLMNSSAFLDTHIYRIEDPLKEATPPEGAPEGTQLPLENLTIHLEALRANVAEVSDNLDKYLQSFSGTLKTLQIMRAPNGPKYLTKFMSNGVSMAKLTELHFWGSIPPNLEFLRWVPNLRTLKFDLGCFEKRDVHIVQTIIRWRCVGYWDSKYEKLEEDMALNVREDLREEILCTQLKYLEIDYDFPDASWRLMGQWMPNLRTLKTILNEETVPVVCEVWRELTELVCLHGSKMGNSCFVRDEGEAGFLGAAVPKLKICDLNDLERFQLNAYCGEGELTDYVVFKGFLKMASLKSVEICVNSQMSEVAEQALKKGMQFCKVVRNNPDYGDPEIRAVGCTCERCTFRDKTENNGLRHLDVNDDDVDPFIGMEALFNGGFVE